MINIKIIINNKISYIKIWLLWIVAIVFIGAAITGILIKAIPLIVNGFYFEGLGMLSIYIVFVYIGVYKIYPTW